MKKLLLTMSISFLLLMMSVSTVFADIPEDFLGLGGGSKPETQKIEATDHGIIVSTEGSYTPDRQAAGIIYKKPIDPKDVTIEFTIDKIPTLNPVQGAQWSQERDSWYAVSLLDKPDFWTTANDDVKSFTLAISPISDNRAYVHAYRTFAGGFFQANWLATIDLSVGTKMNVNIKWVDKTVAATVNGVEIPLDTFNNDQLPTIDPVFPDNAYIAVSGQTGAKMAQFTLEKINDTVFDQPAQSAEVSPSTEPSESATASVEPSASASAEASPDAEAPASADGEQSGTNQNFIYYILGALILIVVAVVVINKSRKSNKM